MRIGVVFPTLEVTDPGAICDYAQAAEDLGYAHLSAWEHVVGADLRSRPDWVGPATLERGRDPAGIGIDPILSLAHGGSVP